MNIISVVTSVIKYRINISLSSSNYWCRVAMVSMWLRRSIETIRLCRISILKIILIIMISIIDISINKSRGIRYICGIDGRRRVLTDGWCMERSIMDIIISKSQIGAIDIRVWINGWSRWSFQAFWLFKQEVLTFH